MKYGNVGSPNIIDTTCEVVHDKQVLAAASNTTLLIHGGGPNNSTTFYDNSTTARTLTTAGNTKFDNSQYKFRVSSIKFDGTGDYISAPDSADWNFGSGDFTFDFWVRFNTVTDETFFAQRNSLGDVNNAFLLDLATGPTRIRLLTLSGGSFTGFYQANWSPSTGTWYHVAVVRNGSSCLMFVDGVALTVTESSAFTTLPDLSSELFIGYSYSGTTPYYLDGWLDEIRISKGIARWTSGFTPPTVPYDSPLTQYVIDGLDGDVDIEYRVIQVLQPASLEYFLRFNNDTGSNYGHQQMIGNNATATAVRGVRTGMQLTYNGAAAASLIDTVIYAKSGKVRTALSRMSNGASGTSITEIIHGGYSWNNTSDNITTIVFATATGLNGYQAGTRLILLKKRILTTGTKTGVIDPQGTTYGHWQLIYDNTLTVARTNMMLSSQMDSYTKLLIHADGADASTAFYNAAYPHHNISASGNAQVDTAQSKFGGASALFDGTGDFLSAPDSADWSFGSGDFTIDFWVRFNTLPGSYQYEIVGQRVDNDNRWGMNFYDSSGSDIFEIQFNDSATSRGYFYSGDLGLSTGTWYHFAFVRSGSTAYLFKDGVSQALTTGTAFGTIGDIAASLVIGAFGDGASRYLNGWLDEIRISKGIARWTANFTPPTAGYNYLNGNSDVMYTLILRGVRNVANTVFNLLPNADFSSNKSNQRLYGVSTTVGSIRQDGTSNSTIGYVDAANEVTMSKTLLSAKSGYVRSALIELTAEISTTTVSSMNLYGWLWQNTADNITSIVVAATQTNGLGIGTHVELWRLNL